MGEKFIIIAAAIAFFGFLATLVWTSVQTRKESGEGATDTAPGDKAEQEAGYLEIGENEEAQDTDEQENGWTEEIDIPPIMEMRATVTDMKCQVRMVGTKQPRTVTEFCVCFENDEGKVFALPVNEEMYQGFEKGQRGILKLCTEDILYSFEPFDEQ